MDGEGIEDIALQADGKIVAVGHAKASPSAGSTAVTARFWPDGTLVLAGSSAQRIALARFWP
jgi:hypothetical protein